MRLNLKQARAGRTSGEHSSGRGFTLIEMVVVLLVIAVVLGIIIPALANARNAARAAATKSLMADVATACNQFQIDQKRLPGYFSAKDMGSSTKNKDGFTGMENIMLDLAGGVVGTSAKPASTPNAIQVGPGQVWVDVDRIGSTTQNTTGTTNKGYFHPDKRYFVAQSQTGQRYSPAAISGGAEKMPVLVDDWGTPILAWAQDPTAGTGSDFAAVDMESATNKSAKFYWWSNAGFLGATKVGRNIENESTDSILGLSPKVTGTDRVKSLAGLLGNPAFPDPNAAAGDPQPLSPRAPLVLHSAGRPAEYLGLDSRGGKVNGPILKYQPIAANGTARDAVLSSGFEDIFTNVGN